MLREEPSYLCWFVETVEGCRTSRKRSSHCPASGRSGRSTTSGSIDKELTTRQIVEETVREMFAVEDAAKPTSEQIDSLCDQSLQRPSRRILKPLDASWRAAEIPYGLLPGLGAWPEIPPDQTDDDLVRDGGTKGKFGMMRPILGTTPLKPPRHCQTNDRGLDGDQPVKAIWASRTSVASCISVNNRNGLEVLP